MIEFFAPGAPIPQGSMRVIRGRLVADNPRLKAWRRTVATAAQAATDRRGIDHPVQIVAEFVFPRLKSMNPSSPLTKATRPDGDKLQRALGDALEREAGILAEDSRINAWFTWKRYAAVGEEPGVLVRIFESGFFQWDELREVVRRHEHE